MNRSPPQSRSLFRWGALLVGSGLAAIVWRPLVASPAEVFWCLFPLFLFVGSALRLFPLPLPTAKSRAGLIAIVFVLFSFPIVFYGGLVWLTKSEWSWREQGLAIYFFSIALEGVLLIVFASFTAIENWLRHRLGSRWIYPALLLEKVLLYTFLVPFLLVVLAVHRPKLIPRPLHESAAPPVELVQFPARDGLRLSGVFLPQSRSSGTVIVCHGVGANHADIQDLFLQLYSSGFQILAFDFRGHGRSAGHTISYGLYERNDVLGAYDYSLTRPDVDSTRLFALGVSMGGASLMQALPEMPRVRAAVVDSAFASLERMADHQLRFFPHPLRPLLVQFVRGLAWLEVGGDIRQLAPADRLREVSTPLLIIHGTADNVVPVEHAELLRVAASSQVTMKIVADAPHIGSVLVDPTGYAQRVKQHFLSTLK